MKPLFVSFVILLFSLGLASQNTVFGKWKTIDDNTGKPKSIVEIYESNGKVYGKVIQLFRPANEDQDPSCIKCSGNKYNKKIIGLNVLENMTKSGDSYANGTITDPENGKEYSCKMWIEGGDLKLRGYWGFLYRTQTWVKVP